MAALFLIIGGIGGGGLGWLLDRRANRTKAETASQSTEACETYT